MRFENVQYKVYAYNELSARAKEKALQDFCNDEDYIGADNEKSLDKFSEIFPVINLSWEYGDRNFINFDLDCEYEEIEKLTGVRLSKYLWNNYKTDLFQGKFFSLWSKTEKSKTNPKVGELKIRHSKTIKDNCCVMTGYYVDEALLTPIYEFMNKPNDNITFKGLIAKCLNSWVKCCNEDYNFHYSEESFQENCDSNNWEFLISGKMY
ncbi:hypothetical protein [Clostridium tagluense]|uniref:Uncharacterized protein n=1 Tax=Clostridium tagluense TaxID=360422 RepID=A0A401UST6_9CLOT|nr:hypothetical protein [Clostridium tagluense]GCD12620.1 hypothetical protein Ctaglu_42430 [Clostridium tagluense]